MVGSVIAASLAEALSFRAETGAVPLAGGTDLMVRYRSGTAAAPDFPWPVVIISSLPELKGIFQSGEGVCIKAGTNLAAVESSGLVHPLLREAVHLIASPALRNLATLAGNICNASPAADAVCVLCLLDAEVELTSLSGSRRIPVTDFITGPGSTLLRADELLTSIWIPPLPPGIPFYRKVGTRRANALSKLSCAGYVRVEGGSISDFRYAIGAVAPTVVRSGDLESHLCGTDAAGFTAIRSGVREAYAALIRPIDDQRSTALYRRETALRLLEEFFSLTLEELA
jgi:xanthine dehydrogenase FAD-binding subunit